MGRPFTPKLPEHGPSVQLRLFAEGRVLLVALNRPESMNAMTDEMQSDLSRVFEWMEQEPSVWCCIITGNSGPARTVKAFCAGQDIKEWVEKTKENQRERLLKNPDGFGSFSRRHSRKPVIAAVDGLCLGGGLELMLNCDLVIATENSIFGFPEVSKGVIAVQGGIPRLLHQCGRALASELLLLGKSITASEARDRFRIVNRVVPKSEDLLPAALEMAKQLISNSPAAVQLTKLSLLETFRRGHQQVLDPSQLIVLKGLETKLGKGIEQSTLSTILRDEFEDLFHGPDAKEGLQSFVEKRRPIWNNPQPRNASSNKLVSKTGSRSSKL